MIFFVNLNEFFIVICTSFYAVPPKVKYPRFAMRTRLTIRLTLDRGFFYFYIFLKIFFTEIYFRFHNLQFYTPTARQGAAGGGRDLYVNKKNLFTQRPLAGACRPPIGRQGGLPPLHWAAGGRQAPPHCIKCFSPPFPLICFPRHPERGRERGGVREGVAAAKPCQILDPNRR